MSEKSQSPSQGKKYYLQLGGKGVVGLSLVAFLISGWMFWLGLQVGREKAPVQFDIERLEQELASLKETIIQEKQKLFNPAGDAPADRAELKFYDILKNPEPKLDTVQIQPEAAKPKTDPPPAPKAQPPPAPEAAKPALEAAQPKIAAKQRPPAPSKPSEEKPYTIQVASLRNAQDANQMVKRLQAKGYPAYQTVIDLPGKGRWHRVRVGSFKDKTDAQNTMERLKKDKIQPMLVKL